MKKIILFLFFFLIIISFSFGQNTLSKEEEKALRNEIRDLIKNPEKYKAMKDAETSEIARIREIGKELFSEEKKLKELKKDLEARVITEKQVNEKSKKQQKNLTASNVEKELIAPPPVIFRVQIGAYQNQYLANTLTNQSNFFVENRDAIMKRYVIGGFKRYEEAQAFTQFINKRGAISFVVAYFTEKRLENIKELPENYRPKER
ncbi:MAG: hypothetical protein EAZ44_02555 [Cytophagia bacterium]|nr:MAG: hypothetical protein EAZ44_02555 [Cytophagia bacterium]